MEIAILGTVVFFSIALFFVMTIQPIWSIVDCLIDSEKSVVSKIVWFIALFFTGILAGLVYSIAGARSPSLRRATLLGVILSIFTGVAACGLTFGTEEGRQWLASAMEGTELPGIDGLPALEQFSDEASDDSVETATVSVASDHDVAELFANTDAEPLEEVEDSGEIESDASPDVVMPNLGKMSASMDALSKLMAGNADEALVSVNEAIRLDATDLDSYILRARVSKELGDTEAFNKDLLHVIRTISENVNSGEASASEYHQRAQALQEFKKFDYAIKDLKKAQELDPDSENYAAQIKVIELQQKYGN